MKKILLPIISLLVMTAMADNDNYSVIVTHTSDSTYIDTLYIDREIRAEVDLSPRTLVCHPKPHKDSKARRIEKARKMGNYKLARQIEREED